MEALGIHTTAPMVDIAHSVLFQFGDAHGAGGQGHRALVMKRARPLPHRSSQSLELVVVGEARHVCLVDRHAGDVQSLGCESTGCTEHEWAGEVHHIWAETAQLGEHGWQWHSDGQGVNSRNFHGGHAHDAEAFISEDFLLAIPRSRGDNHCFVALSPQIFQYSEDGIHHSVDIRKKTFSHDRNTHRR